MGYKKQISLFRRPLIIFAESKADEESKPQESVF